MTVNERTRHQLYEAARASWGEEEAETLLEMLPPVGWGDVATKQDLQGLATKADLDALAHELRSEMLELRAEMRGEIAEMRAEMRGEIANLRAEFQREFARLTRWVVTAIVASLGAAVGIGAAISRMG